MSICCDSSYFQYSLINWPSAGRELMSSSRRREVERSLKAARRQIFIKRCWSLDWVERSFLGWHSAGSATSKTNCSRTNWKIYGSGWESGKAFLQDYLGGKKSSFSQHLVLNFGGLPFMWTCNPALDSLQICFVNYLLSWVKATLGVDAYLRLQTRSSEQLKTEYLGRSSSGLECSTLFSQPSQSRNVNL